MGGTIPQATSSPLRGQDDATPLPFVLGRRPALDGLRGLAILAVMALHSPCTRATGGFIGVDVFFVLSGFLITTLLLQEHQLHGSIALGRFYLRRALRLLPALLGLLLVLWVCTLGWGTGNRLMALHKDVLSVLLYYYNWRQAWSAAPHNALLSHLWSLSVEEQFYLVWPLLLAGLLAAQARRRWLVGLLVLGIAGPAVLRVALRTDDFTWCLALYSGTMTRADALAMGCLVALLAAWGRLPRRRGPRQALRVGGSVAFLVLVLHLPFTNVSDAYLYRSGFFLVDLSAATVLAALIGSPPVLLARLLEARPLGWLGRISYGAYLWNWPLALTITSQMAGAHWLTQSVLIWTGTLAAGALSHSYVEMPFLRLKKRLDRRTSPQPAKVAAVRRVAA